MISQYPYTVGTLHVASLLEWVVNGAHYRTHFRAHYQTLPNTAAPTPAHDRAQSHTLPHCHSCTHALMHCHTLPRALLHTAARTTHALPCALRAHYRAHCRTLPQLLPYTAALPDSRTLSRALPYTAMRTAAHCPAYSAHTTTVRTAAHCCVHCRIQPRALLHTAALPHCHSRTVTLPYTRRSGISFSTMSVICIIQLRAVRNIILLNVRNTYR
jgi:hypothetical protein